MMALSSALARSVAATLMVAALLPATGLGHRHSPESPAPTLHYRPPDGWIGDVHPLCWGGVWHLYGLAIPSEPARDGLAGLRSLDVTSADLLRWSESVPRIAHPDRPWWAIANYRVGQRIYSISNGARGFDLAISDDGSSWRPHPANPVVPYPADASMEVRDPYVCRDDGSGTYFMVAAGLRRGQSPASRAGLFLYATSKDLLSWTPLRVLYDPGDIGIPECPELFRMGPRWYLVGSWGVGRVGQGRYRIADRPTGPWRLPAHDTLDGSELMAPNSGSDGKRRLLVGWIPTYRGQEDGTPFEWGGHLAFPREIRSLPGGELALRLPDEFLKLRGRPVRPAPGVARAWGDGTIVWLPGSRRTFEAAAAFSLAKGSTGARVILERAGTRYDLVVDVARQQMRLFREDQPDRSLAAAPIEIRAPAPLRLRVIVDGEIVEAFLNDRFAIAGRAMRLTGPCRAGALVGPGEGRIVSLVLYPLSLGPRQ